MRRSISRQMTVIFIGLMSFVLVANLMINNFFLEEYYMMKMQRTLVQSYRSMDEHITANGVDEVYFTTAFNELCKSHNISFVVLNKNFDIILYTDNNNTNLMAGRLFGYYVGMDTNPAEVLGHTERYTIQKMADPMIQMDFLEIWGTLTQGDYFIMRIPLESIRLNAGISNEFTMFISLAVVMVSFFLIWWLSKKIARPIRELTDLSSRMANLDFDVKYTSGGENEIGQLGKHFNQMSETLERTISQLKTANNELQKDIERKVQVDEMRKEFLSNVSHELKTPLALIQGYAEGLKECINDDAESREFYCDVIMDEASKMNLMVQKLLTLNQLEFGNEQVVMERFDIVPLLHGKIQSVQILAQQKDAQIQYVGPESLHVWGDEFKVEEVLTNYISNALNHVDGERKISILIQIKQKEHKVRISVFNTGNSIPEEDIDQIWVKFYKVDKARTREYGGNGVGLSIVKAIMDSFHQKYGVSNKADGVEFWFELEYADGEQTSEREETWDKNIKEGNEI